MLTRPVAWTTTTSFKRAAMSTTDGTVNDADRYLALNHPNDWHRNALFGTAVLRTSLCETCKAESTGTIGESSIFWSPDGKQLAFTQHVGNVDTTTGQAACRVFLVRSNPGQGNTLRQFTWDPVPDTIKVHDYDPAWSPKGHQIVYNRYDRRILRKGIPGVASDTTDHLVSASGDDINAGDATPGISPDGQWVAFSRRELSGARHIYKVATTGGTVTQLTSESDGVDFYPQWSNDGTWITFDRQSGPSTNPHAVYKVKSDGTSEQAVYTPASGKDAATPTYSPDGAIVLFGFGTHDTGSNPPRDVTVRTLDPAQSPLHPIANYDDSTHAVQGPDPVLSPRLSPDGTRLALRSKQIWAVRRNMNQPPQFIRVGTQSVADSTTYVSINAKVGLQSTIADSAADPEFDALTYAAYFLQAGMSFDPTTATLTWTPPDSTLGKSYTVRFEVTTPSGGTDAILGILSVVSAAPQFSATRSNAGADAAGPNPTRGEFSIASPAMPGVTAELTIFDLLGRRIATVRGPAGARLRWSGLKDDGALAPEGMYLYRMEVRGARRVGKLALIR